MITNNRKTSELIGKGKRSSWRKGLKRNLLPYLFLSPFLIGFLTFMVYPLIYDLKISMYRTKLIGGTSFVGFENYLRAFSDSNFLEGIRNVLLFGVLQIPVMLGAALIFALLLDESFIRVRFKSFFRLSYFLPFAIPSVVAALIWGYMYGQSFGLFTQIAKALNLQPPVFLSASMLIPSIANISTWQFTGYNMLIIYAALKGIPDEIYEAARVDGANSIQIALWIKIPIALPAILLTTIFSVVGTLQLFNEPNILRAIAPSVINTHFTPNMYMYIVSFGQRQFDYAAAIAFSLALITAVLVSLVLWIFTRQQKQE